MTYEARYAHAGNAIPGILALDAATDAQAVEEVRTLVASGHRNETWARVELAGGRAYTCRNEHGQAVGEFVGRL